jgi:hypothetical protein
VPNKTELADFNLLFFYLPILIEQLHEREEEEISSISSISAFQPLATPCEMLFGILKDKG